MPKKYIHGKRGKTLNYTISDLEKAVAAVHGGLSIRKATEVFGVPRSTLGDRISGRFDINVKHGRPQAVPQEIEDKIVKSVKTASQLGFGLSRKQVLMRTNVLCQRIKLNTSYTNFNAGKDWWEGVKRRHPELVIRKPEKLSSVRARMMNREVVGRYFDDLEKIITDLNLGAHGDRIWNCDETGLNFEHVPVRVVAEKGQRSVVGKTSNKSSNLTIIACVNGAGDKMPPMIITKGKTSKSLHGFRTMDAPDGSVWAYQESGWMTDSIGEQWFDEVFLKHCGPQRPQLLVLDGHSSHETLAIIERAIEENITLMSLPPHCTHYLQPLDRSLFGPFKKAYNAICSDFMSENPLHVGNKWSFPSLFNKAWETALCKENIVSGFSSCGIYPFNRLAIPPSAYGPSQPTDIPVHEKGDNTQVTEDAHILPDVLGDTSHDVVSSTAPVEPMEVSETVDPLTNNEGASGSLVEDLSFMSTNDDVLNIPCLDLSGPSQLLALLSSGELVIEQSPDTFLDNIDESSIADFYLPEQVLTRPSGKQSARQKKTTHRILTSQAVQQEKSECNRIKLEKESRKNKKRQKKEKP